MMMSVLALCLVTSLLTATVWSPQPQQENNKYSKAAVILKEEHRVLVVKYEKEGILHSNEVLISSSQDQTTTLPSKPIEIEEKSSSNLIEISSPLPTTTQPYASSPNDITCDPFGKCKHKLAGAFNIAKEEVSEKAHKVEETAKQLAGEATVNATKKVVEKAIQAEEKVENMAERVKTSAYYLKEETQQNLTEIYKRGKEVAYDACRYAISVTSVSQGCVKWVMDVVGLVGLATAYGTCVWVTFVSSHVLDVALPRKKFGVVQSKIYPVYFRVVGFSIGVCLVAHMLREEMSLLARNKAEMVQSYVLLVSLVMVLINLLWLEPRASTVMFERMKIENEEGKGKEYAQQPVIGSAATTSIGSGGGGGVTSSTATCRAEKGRDGKHEEESRQGKLNRRLRKLNTWSSLLNVMTLMALTWRLVYIGQCLSMKC